MSSREVSIGTDHLQRLANQLDQGGDKAVELGWHSPEPANHQRTGKLECVDAVDTVFLTLDRLDLLRSLPTQRLGDVEYQCIGMDVLLYRMGYQPRTFGKVALTEMTPPEHHESTWIDDAVLSHMGTVVPMIKEAAKSEERAALRTRLMQVISFAEMAC